MASTRNNCVGMATQALLVGGLGIFAKPPTNWVFMDASSLVQWAQKAVERIDKMNELHDRFALNILGDPELRRTGVPKERTAPTLEEWKKDSDKGIAFYARRKEQIEVIDKALRRYHQVDVNDSWKRLGYLLMI